MTKLEEAKLELQMKKNQLEAYKLQQIRLEKEIAHLEKYVNGGWRVSMHG